MKSKLTYKTEYRKTPFGVENSTSVFAFNLLINNSKMENDFSAEQHLNDLNRLINENSDQASEIFYDLNSRTQECLRYKMVKSFRESHGSGIIRSEDISNELMSIARCWCCGTTLDQCLSLKEEDFTYISKEVDPYIFDRAEAAGMTFVDSKGRKKILMCGYSYS